MQSYYFIIYCENKIYSCCWNILKKLYRRFQPESSRYVGRIPARWHFQWISLRWWPGDQFFKEKYFYWWNKLANFLGEPIVSNLRKNCRNLENIRNWLIYFCLVKIFFPEMFITFGWAHSTWSVRLGKFFKESVSNRDEDESPATPGFLKDRFIPILHRISASN